MILKDTITDLIIQMDVFMNKQGRDLEVCRNIIHDINQLTGEDSLDKIYVNTVKNFNIPDVVVLPLYNKEFNRFLLDEDPVETCPFGYTIEIHERCFDSYTAEELTAIVIHDILQNIESSSAKTRYMKAYNSTVSKYPMEKVMNIFDTISNSEVAFIAYTDICTRPFRVPIMDYDYTGCDEVLKNMGLGDAYDSYLEKYYDGTKNWKNNQEENYTDPQKIIEDEIKADSRTMNTIFMACMDHDIRHYYTMIRNGIPLVSLDNIMGKTSSANSMGFIPKVRKFKRRYSNKPANYEDKNTTLTESFINPKNEVELRFQVDKIIADMRYAASEAEREAILIKIKNLTLKLLKTRTKAEAEYKKTPNDQQVISRIEYLQNFIDELEMLREKTMKMDIKKKRYGLFINYPEGYEEDLSKYRDMALY